MLNTLTLKRLQNLEIVFKRAFSNSILNTVMSKSAIVVVADGSEEIEAVTPIDILRRAGINVTVAGLSDTKFVTCSRNVILGTEISLTEAIKKQNLYDIIVLPGGLKGAEAFAESKELGEILKNHEKSGSIIAALCAAPIALKKHQIFVGKRITSHPSVRDKMKEGNQYDYQEERVIVDGNLITSRGPGTALEWSLTLVEKLVGEDKKKEISEMMLAKE